MTTLKFSDVPSLWQLKQSWWWAFIGLLSCAPHPSPSPELCVDVSICLSFIFPCKGVALPFCSDALHCIWKHCGHDLLVDGWHLHRWPRCEITGPPLEPCEWEEWAVRAASLRAHWPREHRDSEGCRPRVGERHRVTFEGPSNSKHSVVLSRSVLQRSSRHWTEGWGMLRALSVSADSAGLTAPHLLGHSCPSPMSKWPRAHSPTFCSHGGWWGAPVLPGSAQCWRAALGLRCERLRCPPSIAERCGSKQHWHLPGRGHSQLFPQSTAKAERDGERRGEDSFLKVPNTKSCAEIRKSSAMGKEKEIPRTVAMLHMLSLERLSAFSPPFLESDCAIFFL